MLKAQRDNAISRLSDEDRQGLRRVISVIKERRGASSSLPSHRGRLTAREVAESWPEELSPDACAAVEAILARDETGPKVGEAAPDFDLKRLGTEERVRLSDFRGQRSVALAFGSYT